MKTSILKISAFILLLGISACSGFIPDLAPAPQNETATSNEENVSQNSGSGEDDTTVSGCFRTGTGLDCTQAEGFRTVAGPGAELATDIPTTVDDSSAVVIYHVDTAAAPLHHVVAIPTN